MLEHVIDDIFPFCVFLEIDGFYVMFFKELQCNFGKPLVNVFHPSGMYVVDSQFLYHWITSISAPVLRDLNLQTLYLDLFHRDRLISISIMPEEDME